MVDMLVWGYLGGAIIATFVVLAAARQLSDRRSPSDHPLVLSIVAGELWPLLVLGVVELSAIMVYAKVASKPEPDVGIFA